MILDACCKEGGQSRPPHPPKRGQKSPRFQSITALIAFTLAALPLLIWYARRMMDHSDEPLGVIALLVAVFTLAVAARYGKRDRARILPGRMLAGAALLAILQFSGVVRYPLLAGLLAIAIIAASVSMPRGKAGVIALLVLSLPLIASLDFFAGYPLRLVVAQMTTGLLQFGGIPVERTGVMLIDGERIVGIDPPCAGIRMLWTSCFVAAVLAARMRLSWLRTFSLLALAVVCVVIGNVLRAAVVYFPESGRVEWPDWAHPGVGLLVHGCVLAAVFGISNRLDCLERRCHNTSWWRNGRRLAVSSGVLLLAFAGMLAVGRGHDPIANEASDWPTMLDGVALIPLPLSAAETQFLRAFPGDIAKFSWGEAEVIMRRTNQPTRLMHPSGDCLRAAGFKVHSEPVFRDTDSRLWGSSIALRNGTCWLVHERYVSASGAVTTDASAWYWQALLHPEDGPWTATTVISQKQTGSSGPKRPTS
jgi:exosortase